MGIYCLFQHHFKSIKRPQWTAKIPLTPGSQVEGQKPIESLRDSHKILKRVVVNKHQGERMHGRASSLRRRFLHMHLHTQPELHYTTSVSHTQASGARRIDGSVASFWHMTLVCGAIDVATARKIICSGFCTTANTQYCRARNVIKVLVKAVRQRASAGRAVPGGRAVLAHYGLF